MKNRTIKKPAGRGAPAPVLLLPTLKLRVFNWSAWCPLPKNDPCRLVRQVSEILRLDRFLRVNRPLPPCVAGESDSSPPRNSSDMTPSSDPQAVESDSLAGRAGRGLGTTRGGGRLTTESSSPATRGGRGRTMQGVSCLPNEMTQPPFEFSKNAQLQNLPRGRENTRLRLGQNLLLMLVVSSAAWPALADEPQFEFSKEVKAPPLKQEELLSAVLDTDVFAATNDSLTDVRLLDSEGKPVPYLLRKVQTTRARATRTTWAAGKLTAKPLDNGGLEITVQFDEDEKRLHPNGLSVISPLRNFEQRVRVYTSDDGQQWEPAGEEAVIFDYSRFMDVRSDSVPFPETSRRNFRIVIDKVTGEQQSELLALTRRLRGTEETERTEQVTIDRRPFRIDRIDFWREVDQDRATGDEKTGYPVAGHRIERDAKKQQSIVYVDLRRQPLTSLELETADRNFSRHAVIEVERAQGVKKTWEKIGEGALSRVDFKNLKRETLSISFREARHLQYRIVIDDRDSPPLEVTGVKAEGSVYEVVYLSAPDAHNRLLYGSADAEPATYDTATVQELLSQGFRPAQAELGPQMPGKGGGAGPPAVKWSKLLTNPLLLGGVITLLVIVLGWALFRAVKRMDAVPHE